MYIKLLSKKLKYFYFSRRIQKEKKQTSTLSRCTASTKLNKHHIKTPSGAELEILKDRDGSANILRKLPQRVGFLEVRENPRNLIKILFLGKRGLSLLLPHPLVPRLEP